MCPADDLFDIIEPEDNGSAENKDFVQDESFLQGLDFIDGLPEDDAEGDNGSVPADDEILLDVDMSGSSSDDAADNADNDVVTDEADIPEDIPDSNEEPEIAIRSDIPESSEDSFAFASNFVANAQKSDGSAYEEAEDDQDEDISDEDEIEEDDMEDQEDMMIVTEGTMITGSIATDRSLLVLGTINGDINCEGKLTISGTVTGNSYATDVFINDQRTEGNITCTGIVKIGQGSVIAGAVKGNLDVRGPVILDSTAVIKGNIKAKSVQLINGAVLEGFCSLEEYSNSNMDEIFKP